MHRFLNVSDQNGQPTNDALFLLSPLLYSFNVYLSPSQLFQTAFKWRNYCIRLLFRRQASDLADRTSPDQAVRLKEPLAKVNGRWEDLLRGLVDRQRELEHALLRLGQFQHALNELLVWIQRTDNNLDELKPVFGDPSVIEIELAKLKVLINDIQAHQTSVDTLNDAGRQLVESGKGSDDANKTQQRLVLLNKKWSDLCEKASNRQKVHIRLELLKISWCLNILHFVL